MNDDIRIGLALSGGGSRAIAFHLGCLRALHRRGILDRVRVLSSVSGGSLIAAMYAYHAEPFDAFERRVKTALGRGFAGGIARHTFLTFETIKIIATVLTAGVLAHIGMLLVWISKGARMLGADEAAMAAFARTVQAPLRRWASRSTAFERYLREHFGDTRINEVKRPQLEVVINAAELRTGTAFRFGSRALSCWRYGEIAPNDFRVSKAVAASAAYPLLLPAFDDRYAFSKKGNTERHRVILTDGGVYDNLGLTCLLPGRSAEHAANVFDVNFIICCDAGAGQPLGTDLPYTWASRLSASFVAVHRRTHSLSYDLLHRLDVAGEIKGFLLPYLGQIDRKLPRQPADMPCRDEVMDYPTDFSPMDAGSIERLSARGEKLTELLIETYHPNL